MFCAPPNIFTLSNRFNSVETTKLIDFRALLPLETVRSCCILIFQKHRNRYWAAIFCYYRSSMFGKAFVLTRPSSLSFRVPSNQLTTIGFQWISEIAWCHIGVQERPKCNFCSLNFLPPIKHLRLLQNPQWLCIWIKIEGGVVITKRNSRCSKSEPRDVNI